MGGLFPRQDRPLSYRTHYLFLLVGENSSCFLITRLLLLSRLTELSGIGEDHWMAAVRGNVRAVTSRQQKPLIANVTFILLLGQLNGAGR